MKPFLLGFSASAGIRLDQKQRSKGCSSAAVWDLKSRPSTRPNQTDRMNPNESIKQNIHNEVVTKQTKATNQSNPQRILQSKRNQTAPIKSPTPTAPIPSKPNPPSAELRRGNAHFLEADVSAGTLLQPEKPRKAEEAWLIFFFKYMCCFFFLKFFFCYFEVMAFFLKCNFWHL